MNYNSLFRIQGYLCALADVISLFKSSYTYSFDFISFETLNAEEAVKIFLSDPKYTFTRHYISSPKLKKCLNLEKEFLDLINRWFFNDIAFSESELGYYENEDGEKIPLNRLLKYNYIALGLLKSIKDFLGEEASTVYRLDMEITEQDEFAWEQYLFEVNNNTYMLQLYRQG